MSFLQQMDAVAPWAEWVKVIEPHYYTNKRGRRAVPLETMLRVYLLQVWFHLSDEGVEDQINDMFAMRQFMRLRNPAGSRRDHPAAFPTPAGETQAG